MEPIFQLMGSLFLYTISGHYFKHTYKSPKLSFLKQKKNKSGFFNLFKKALRISKLFLFFLNHDRLFTSDFLCEFNTFYRRKKNRSRTMAMSLHKAPYFWHGSKFSFLPCKPFFMIHKSLSYEKDYTKK